MDKKSSPINVILGVIIGGTISIIPLWTVTLLLCPGLCDSSGWLGTIYLASLLALILGAVIGGLAGRKKQVYSFLFGLVVGVVGIMLNMGLQSISRPNWGENQETSVNGIESSSDSPSFEAYWDHPLSGGVAENMISYGLIAADKDGRIWIETVWHEDKTINYFDGDSWQDLSWADSGLCTTCSSLRGLAADGHGKIWISTSDGIANYDGEDWQTFTLHDVGLGSDDSDQITWIVAAPNGDVWVDTDWRREGISGFTPRLLHYNGTEWKTYTFENAPIPEVGLINDIDFDQQGRVWIGGSAGLAMLEDGKGTLFTKSNSDLGNDFVQQIHIDALDRVWLKKANALDHGLQVFDGENFTTFPQDDFKCNMMSITSDDTGKVWVGSCNGSILSYEDGKWRTHNKAANSLGNINNFNDFIYYLNEQVNVLVGFESGGYESGSFSIDDIAIDKKGRVWVMSSESLQMYDGENWVTMNTENAGTSWENGGELYVDETGNLWVFSPTKVSVFDDE